MTDKPQPEALRLAALLDADEWPGSMTLVSYARACVAELCRLHAENETLRAQQAEKSHIKLLAECRCAFPVPEPGSPLEVQWAAAMACPEEVPEYVRMCAASMQASPKAARQQPVACEPLIRQLVAALEGYRRNHHDTQPCDAEREGRAWLDGAKLAAAPTTQPAPQPSPAAQGDALDAGRWRRLVNASELSFPVATIADDPENGAVMLYGRKALEDFVDRMDEIPNTYDAARAAQEGKSHEN